MKKNWKSETVKIEEIYHGIVRSCFNYKRERERKKVILVASKRI